MYIYLYIYISCICGRLYIWRCSSKMIVQSIYVYIYIHVCIHIFACVYVCVFIYLYIHTWMYIHMTVHIDEKIHVDIIAPFLNILTFGASLMCACMYANNWRLEFKSAPRPYPSLWNDTHRLIVRLHSLLFLSALFPVTHVPRDNWRARQLPPYTTKSVYAHNKT